MLVFLQHNVAHLGIVTGLCLAEAATTHLPLFLSGFLLLTAVAASIATALAEILGGALAISMLTGMPVIPVALLFAVALFLPVSRLLRQPAWPAVQSMLESSGKHTILETIIRGMV